MCAASESRATVAAAPKGKTLPAPSPVQNGEAAVEMPLLTATKAALNLMWRERGLSKWGSLFARAFRKRGPAHLEPSARVAARGD